MTEAELAVTHPRRNNMRKSRKAAWCASLETTLVNLRPELRGKVDWSTAYYLHNQGYSPKDAADKMSGMAEK